mmetsp:Transcript_6127/g.18864  ORF Transcript_6127/g.18864 Transcript_6127/m.18864 type:complete len:324 (+) Transcript_6127:76-1047(+)
MILRRVVLLLGASVALVPRSTLPRLRARRQRAAATTMMGRKFENNKVKMAKTAAAYTKKASYIGKKIKVAVKAGGPDPDSNRALGLVIKEAQALNVKREIADRNIKAASSDKDSADFKELTYELYGHGGVGFVINALSDNNNRAFTDVGTGAGTKPREMRSLGAPRGAGLVPNIPSAFEADAARVGTVVKKAALKLAETGSVVHNFEKKGRITINAALDEDDLIELALENDVDDVEAAAPDQDTRDDGEEVKTVVFVPPNDLGAMQAALQGAGHDCVANLVHEPIPGTLVKCSEEDLEKNLRVLDKMVEVEDVDTVEHNIDFS